MTKIKEKEELNSPVFSFSNKVIRVLWGAVYNCFFRFSPKPFFSYRAFVLRMFGAEIGEGCAIYPNVKIWLPSNLIVKNRVAIGPRVEVYNQGKITIGNNSIISQGAHLCASTHDYNNSLHPLILSPILIEDNVWVCADAFIGPYVNVSEGSVVGARAVLNKNTLPWNVYAGNPAIKIKQRERFSR